jgi:hypothetical protein
LSKVQEVGEVTVVFLAEKHASDAGAECTGRRGLRPVSCAEERGARVWHRCVRCLPVMCHRAHDVSVKCDGGAAMFLAKY